MLLPTFDDDIFAPGTDIDALAWRWDAQAQLRPMTAEQMSGADVRAQRFGIPGDELMEQAGTATAAAARALMVSTDRAIESLVLIARDGTRTLITAERELIFLGWLIDA